MANKIKLTMSDGQVIESQPFTLDGPKISNVAIIDAVSEAAEGFVTQGVKAGSEAAPLQATLLYVHAMVIPSGEHTIKLVLITNDATPFTSSGDVYKCLDIRFNKVIISAQANWTNDYAMTNVLLMPSSNVDDVYIYFPDSNNGMFRSFLISGSITDRVTPLSNASGGGGVIDPAIYTAINQLQTDLSETNNNLANTQSDLDAAETQIADNISVNNSQNTSISNLTTSVDSKVSKSGDVMTGALILPNTDGQGLVFNGADGYINDSSGSTFIGHRDKFTIVGKLSDTGVDVRAPLHAAKDNNFIAHDNEFNFGNVDGSVYLQYRNSNITDYIFCNGKQTAALNGLANLRFRALTDIINQSAQVFILPMVGYEEIEPEHDTNAYYKALVKWVCARYPNIENGLWLGLVKPSSISICMLEIYNTSKLNSSGYPEWAVGINIHLDGTINTFGFSSYNWFFK